MTTKKIILDVCCGSKMFWFDKNNQQTIYGDIRTESHILCDNRKLEINPDIEMDFRNIPFPENRFKLVVFDPPHLKQLGNNSWMARKYGKLFSTWKDDLTQGFSECFRVLEPNGILIFKWNESQIKLSEVLSLTSYSPLFGHPCAKQSKTHWITFIKFLDT